MFGFRNKSSMYEDILRKSYDLVMRIEETDSYSKKTIATRDQIYVNQWMGFQDICFVIKQYSTIVQDARYLKNALVDLNDKKIASPDSINIPTELMEKQKELACEARDILKSYGEKEREELIAATRKHFIQHGAVFDDRIKSKIEAKIASIYADETPSIVA